MSAPYNPYIDLEVGRGAGLYLKINGRPVDDTYGAIVMAELAALRDELPAVRVDVAYRGATRPAPAAMARLINTELDRKRDLGLTAMRSPASTRAQRPVSAVN